VTWLLALGTNLSALWILVANGWMQFPVGTEFKSRHHAHGVTSFAAVLFQSSRAGQVVHTVSAGYVLGAMFCALDQRLVSAARAQCGFRQAFDLTVAGELRLLGAIRGRARDESGYTIFRNQKMNWPRSNRCGRRKAHSIVHLVRFSRCGKRTRMFAIRVRG